MLPFSENAYIIYPGTKAETWVILNSSPFRVQISKSYFYLLYIMYMEAFKGLTKNNFGVFGGSENHWNMFNLVYPKQNLK